MGLSCSWGKIMDIESVLFNQIIISMVGRKKDMLESICRTYFAFLQEQETKRNSMVDNCSKLIDWANGQIHMIKDSVFIKQAKTFIDTGVELTEISIDAACRKLEEDVDCIINSRIPPWLSSVCYVFSHQWRKVVYEEIIKNYVFIVKYAEKEQAEARKTFDREIDSKKLATREVIIAQTNALFQDIRQQVIADNKILLKIN